jgi:hypothetical protein
MDAQFRNMMKGITTTPKEITPEVERLCQQLGATSIMYLEPPYITDRNQTWLQECHHNVRTRVKNHGGSFQYGWIIWETANVYLIEITPQPDNESKIVFASVENRTFDFATNEYVPNVPLPLHDDEDTLGYIGLLNAWYAEGRTKRTDREAMFRRIERQKLLLELALRYAPEELQP